MTKSSLWHLQQGPYKFIHSVMSAVDDKYADVEEFELIDELSRISGTVIPKAIEEIRNADIRHTRECRCRCYEKRQ